MSLDEKSAALPRQTAEDAVTEGVVPRAITYRTCGHGHGPIIRLMSPSNLGQRLKPFVFLDIFDFGQMTLRAMAMGDGMPIHPHSGVATVTVLTEGRLHFADPAIGTARKCLHRVMCRASKASSSG